MEVRIPRSVVEPIRAHAQETYPEECCGFLIGRDDGDVRHVTEGRRARNVHPGMREVRYTIEPRDVLKVDREFRGEVKHIGFYHSHPDHPARPSAFDLERAWPWYVYTILAVRNRAPAEFTAWVLTEEPRAFKEVPTAIV